MNEQAFTYEHFDNVSYFIGALALMYSLMVLMPILMAPQFKIFGILYAIICGSIVVYRWVRILLYTRKYKALSPQTQKQILKRHRYSLKWLIPLGLVSIAVAALFSKVFEMDYVQITGVWGLSFLIVLFFGLRVFLHDLKSRMTSVAV